eukprot:c8411_g1_i1.p1 GENE.c8411_g1_i1~~c8411_g1_i1.p1  ORF type:complete len:640 (+),score=194.38 c8411_g1_i1:109-1920(+)
MKVFCWGSNQYGQCGRPRPTYIKAPVDLPFFDSLGARQIAASGDYSAVITDVLWANGRIPDVKLIDQQQELFGNSRAGAKVSDTAMQLLLQADKMAEEWAVEADDSIAASDKPEAKFQADVRVAKIHGVNLAQIQNVPDALSAAPFLLKQAMRSNAHHTLVAVETGQIADHEKANDAADQNPEPTPKPTGSGTLGEDSNVNRDPPSLDELKSTGPVASEELDGEEIEAPPGQTLPPVKPPPPIIPVSPFIDWFTVWVFPDGHCAEPSQTINGKNIELCSQIDGQVSLSLSPSTTSSGKFEVREYDFDNSCSGKPLITFSVVCGEECVSHPSSLGEWHWTIRCGYHSPVANASRLVNGTKSIFENVRKFWSQASNPNHESALPEPYRNCHPDDSKDLDCHSTEIDRVWEEAKKRLKVEEPVAEGHRVAVEAALTTPTRHKLIMTSPHDGEDAPVPTAATGPILSPPVSSDGKSVVPAPATNVRNGPPGGRMEFDLFDDSEPPVRVAGVEQPKIIELGKFGSTRRIPQTPDTQSISQSTQPITTDKRKLTKLVKYPVNNVDTSNLYPKPNPLAVDLKTASEQQNSVENIQLGEGNGKDDFEEFFE